MIYSTRPAPLYTPAAVLPPWSNGTNPDTYTTVNIYSTTTIPAAGATATGGAPLYGY